MRFTYFEFENFKGIEKARLDLKSKNDANVYTLVGLNESGKTTILEAINYFIYNTVDLAPLEIDRYKAKDVHDLIPINKRDNFNGEIIITGGLEFEQEDIQKIKKIIFNNSDYNGITISKKIAYTQTYVFENSKHIKDKYSSKWTKVFTGKKKRSKKVVNLPNDIALLANPVIKTMMPSILYFPNFLFEFPEKIYLDREENEKESFYHEVIQDILNSLDNNLDIKTHILDRMNSVDVVDKRSLNSVINKMNRKLTETIFSSWNQIFGKIITDKEIILYVEKDEIGTYIEFNIQDNVDTYRISERSLGFRWFFVYLLLTQFRSSRKQNNNALFLLDEPASNLHPSAQAQLLNSFNKLNRVIYTTHSHYLVNPKWLEQTFVVKNTGVDYDKMEDYSSRKTNVEIHKYKDFATKHPNQTTYFQPILEVLDYVPSQFDMVANSILVEGKSDFYFYKYMVDVVLKMKTDTVFIPSTSASNMETIISLYTGWNKKFIVLLDSDKEGKKQQKRYIENFGDLVKDRILTYQEINAEWKNHGLEKLVTKVDQLKLIKASFPEATKFNKNSFNRSVQELLIKDKLVELSAETIENFKAILAHLEENLVLDD